MNIYDELNKISWKKKEYFLWKHNLHVFRTEEMTEEEICDKLQVKTLSHMKKWEKSSDYLRLVNLYIESQSAKDLEDIYEIVKEKALTGDEKSIKLLMDIQKQARTFNQTYKVENKVKDDDENEAYSSLEL